ncbi:TIGR03084 family metal-binding protein [Streptomyces sp. MST-110588]|uniref:TIGR03084 family metal-binding protein n=1 Tax=Streptomyces sp. MST-110588 TaxID=2833628 RepID=UPI001F5CE9DB|nr:TIGR03084 family metal-binding protein [Streptomyces sp. MST-110588]UNO40387.1 TIGR03084 family protein [Streptomyces sp. MST-110588]
MSGHGAVLSDLKDESEELDGLVAGLSPEEWRTTTPAPGWTIAHQIGHLAWTDQQVLTAANDPERFRRVAAQMLAESAESFVDEGAAREAQEPPDTLLARWRAGRDGVQRVLAGRPADAGKLPWFATAMSVASMATGRLMETWAHGQDIADALGVRRTPTARLRHVARIGVRARDYAYMAHGLTPPPEEFRVELRAPDGGTWEYGPPDAAQRVTGDALDFCLLVTQRAHRDDVAVRAEGADAERWLTIAQAFAGPPGKGRERGAGNQGGGPV